MPPRGQKRSYKIESMYYTLPTMKKILSSRIKLTFVCSRRFKKYLTFIFQFQLPEKQTNKQTHFSHSIIIHLKGTRQN